eukprot:m51a1_g2132 hypothetical protein (716) ;mRNA; f:1706380-1709021
MRAAALVLALAACCAVADPAPPRGVDLTVALVARGNFGLLRNALRALRADLSATSSAASEVVVVQAFAADYSRAESLESALGSVTPAPRVVAVAVAGGAKLAAALAAAVAAAMRAANGSAVAFVDESVEVAPGFAAAAVRAARTRKAAVQGCLLLNSDATTVHHAGVAYSMGKLGRRYRYVVDADQDLSTRNVPLPYNRLQGYNRQHPDVASTGAVPGVGAECVVFDAQTYGAVGGVNETLGDRVFLLDYSLRAKGMFGLETLVCHECSGLWLDAGAAPAPADAEDSDAFEDEMKPFLRRWMRTIDQGIIPGYLMQNTTLIWSMECGAGQTLGFTTEAINFVLALKDVVPLNIEISNKQQCKDEMAKAGWPLSLVGMVQRLSNRVIEFKTNSVLVVHRDPGRFRPVINERWGEPTPARTVGRSMYETDKVPAEWVDSCNSVVQQVWVPSQFNVASFVAAGVNASRVVTLPEPVDTTLYSPGIYKPLVLPERKGFAFLTVGKWEKRKGFDILIRAYLEEFGKDDDVSLYIRSNMDAKNIKEFEEWVQTISKEKAEGPNADKGLPPKPRLLTTMLPVTKMPSLYAAADAFVLPTHGEGWGLPIIEAMSMELPVIATNWSGTTEFAKKEHAFLVEVSGLVDSPTPGNKWAQPSIKSLREQMRLIFNDPKAAKLKAALARQYVVEHFSHSAVAKRVIERVKGLSSLPPYHMGVHCCEVH